MADTKPSNREKIKEILAGIEQGIQELFQSDKYADYLRTMSRFHSYSLNNTILIHLQMANATHVAGFRKWQKDFGRHVKKGEKGLTIIAPTPYKKKIEEMKLDPETKAPMLDKDGNVMVEEKIVEIPLFHPVKVFDVSQTEGRPLPSLVSDLTGDVKQYEAFMEALRRTSPVPMEFKPLDKSMDGYFDPSTQSITIREGMSEVQTVCAAVHEIAHSILHNREQTQLTAAAGTETEEPPKPKDTNTQEVEAESVSFAVCQFFGIETEANSLGYIAGWSKDKTLPELKSSLETISKTANSLINDIDRHFKAICKERGISLDAQETVPAQDAPVQDAPAQEMRQDAGDSPERLIGDLLDLMDRLYQENAINKNFPQEGRDEIKANLTDRLRHSSESVRKVLEQFVQQDTGAEEARAMLTRLDKLDLGPDRADSGSITEPDHALEQPEAPAASQPENEQDREFMLIGNSVYLYIQFCDAGWDYTLYDKETMRQLDGGQLDAEDMTLPEAAAEICTQNGIRVKDIKPLPLDMLEILLDQAAVQDISELDAVERVQPEPSPAAVQDTTLDEYPMPDPVLGVSDLEAQGYQEGDLLPLDKDRASELLDRDFTIYAVTPGEPPAMLFDAEELAERGGNAMFAVPREEWEESREFRDAVAGRMDRQEERERAFLNHTGDCFAIYQLKLKDDSLEDIRYESLDGIKYTGHTVDRANYELAYTAPLAPAPEWDSPLEALWYQFNNEHPKDYQRPSLSVSDIIAIRQEGVLSCHYCDSVDFAVIPDFIQPENYLKNAEMAMEDDYGMIDGVINNGPKEGPTVAELEAQVKAGNQISLMDLAEAVHREKPKKSVLGQLKTQPKQERKKSTPKKSAEKER